MNEFHTRDYLITATPIERERWDDVWKQITMQVVGFDVTIRVKREGVLYFLTADERDEFRAIARTTSEAYEQALDTFVGQVREREPDGYFLPEGARITSISWTME